VYVNNVGFIMLLQSACVITVFFLNMVMKMMMMMMMMIRVCFNAGGIIRRLVCIT